MGDWRFGASKRWWILALALGACAHPEATRQGAAPVSASSRAQKERKVRRLMVLTGAEASGNMMFDLMQEHFKRSEEMPPGFMEKFREVVAREPLLEQLVPIYMKHLSEEDVDAAIAFHESTAGKHFLALQPTLLQEAKDVGEAWGARLALEALEELKEDRAQEERSGQLRL